MRTGNFLQRFICFCAGLGLTAAAETQGLSAGNLPPAQPASESRQRAVVEEPARRSGSLFQGEQGRQKTEIYFDRATGMVTMKMLVQDSNGYFIPNIRRDNFVVYENGVRQQNATVEIEHAPVSMAVLLEWGGRYQALNRALGDQVPRAAHQLLDELGRDDKVAVFRYGDRLERLADFSSGREALDTSFVSVDKPDFSELNFYDALISTVDYMKKVSGRKAILLISSGVDTFSKARYEDALVAARDGGTPIYVIDIAPALRTSVQRAWSGSGPYARIDWNRAEAQLQEIAKISGGRVYAVESTFDLSGVYDDLMENLRVRYVITYKSNSSDLGAPRTVRIELVDPSTGGPLEIVDANGKPVRWQLVFENTYTPASAVSLSRSPEVKRRG